MNDDWISIGALAAGGVLFVVAALAYLVRETRGVPRRQRLAAMGGMAWHAVRRRLPSRDSVVVASTGIGVFLGTALICAPLGWGLLEWYASTLPAETTVVDGAATAALLSMYAVMGLGFSLVVGSVCGTVMAGCVSSRLMQK